MCGERVGERARETHTHTHTHTDECREWKGAERGVCGGEGARQGGRDGCRWPLLLSRRTLPSMHAIVARPPEDEGSTSILSMHTRPDPGGGSCESALFSNVWNFVCQPARFLPTDETSVSLPAHLKVTPLGCVSHINANQTGVDVMKRHCRFLCVPYTLLHQTRVLMCESIMARTILPPLCELHSIRFPVYFKIRLTVETSVMDDGFVVSCVKNVSEALERHFGSDAVDASPERFRVVVAKRPAYPQPVSGMSWERCSESEQGSAAPSAVAEKVNAAASRASPDAPVVHLPVGQAGDMVGMEVDSSCVVRCASGAFRPMDRSWSFGIHVHVPDIVVDIDRMGILRETLINKLSHHGKLWTGLFGGIWTRSPRRTEWCRMVTERCYFSTAPRRNMRGGIRMLGVPKPVQCGKAKTKTHFGTLCDCELNQGYFLDRECVYSYHSTSVRGTMDEGESHRVRMDPLRCLRETSVRCQDDTPLTETFLNDRSPAVVEGSLFATRGSTTVVASVPPRLPGGAGASSSQLAHLNVVEQKIKQHEFGAKRKRHVEVEDGRVQSMMAALAADFSEHYVNVGIRVLYLASERTYQVLFSGEDAEFCPNLNGHHDRPCVYMVVRPTSVDATTYRAILKCSCTDAINRRGPGQGGTFCQRYVCSMCLTKEASRLLER